MTDDPREPDNRRFESASSDELVDSIAESEGLSRDDVLQQLISSYWTLNEMFRLMEQTEEDFEADSPADNVDLSGAIGPSPPEFESFKDEVTAEFNRVSGEIESIREEFDSLKSTVRNDEESIQRLEKAVKSLDTRISDVDSKLSDQHQNLRSRFNDEFENLEVILNYLIETTDEIDARTDIFEADHLGIHKRWAESDQLAELKQRANRINVKTAACDYCDATVDIALLERPQCPQCDRPIEDIEPKSGWFGFGSNRLLVSDEPIGNIPAPENAEPESTTSVEFDDFSID